MRKLPSPAPFLLLDAWRGIAALWVVMIHSCLAFLATGDNAHFIGFPLYAVSVWGQLGVVMFFVISGYCITGAAYSTLTSGRSVGTFGRDRVRRIYPPYLAACAVTVAFGSVIAAARAHGLLPPVYHQIDSSAWNQPLFWISNALLLQHQFGQPNLLFVAWSLCYEITFYAMIGVLIVVSNLGAKGPLGLSRPVAFQIGIGSLTILSLAWLLISPKTCPFPLDRWYQFGIGAILFLTHAAKTHASGRNETTLLVFAGLLTCLFAFRKAYFPDSTALADPVVLGHPGPALQAATCVVFVGALWLLRPFDAFLAHCPPVRPFMWLGTISYSVYLVHILVISLPDAAGRHIGFDGHLYWVTYFLEIAVAIFSGWIFFLAVERHFISKRQKQRVIDELGESKSTPAPLSPRLAESKNT